MYATPVLPSATTSNVRASLLHVLQVVLCMLPGDISACVMSYIVHRLLCVAPSRGQSPLCALFSWTGRVRGRFCRGPATRYPLTCQVANLPGARLVFGEAPLSAVKFPRGRAFLVVGVCLCCKVGVRLTDLRYVVPEVVRLVEPLGVLDPRGSELQVAFSLYSLAAWLKGQYPIARQLPEAFSPITGGADLDAVSVDYVVHDGGILRLVADLFAAHLGFGESVLSSLCGCLHF